MRFIKVSFPADKSDQVIDILNEAQPVDWSMDSGYGQYEKAVEIVAENAQGQTILDALQGLLSSGPDWRVVVMPIEATLPRVEPPVPDPDELKDKEKAKQQAKTTSLREELYQKVTNDCKLNWDFIVLTILSAIVAAIGLNEDSVAIVIAAMVIAPFLGPILAFAFATALGDTSLMWKASKTGLIGLSIGFFFALGLSQFLNVNLESTELISRTVLGPEILALALASGAAAALSLSTGISSALVGVMVAVALLPPAVASALFLGIGEFEKSAGAALLLAINVVCAILSAQLIFVWKGVRPRTWFSQQKATKAMRVNVILWICLIALLAFLSFRLSLWV